MKLSRQEEGGRTALELAGGRLASELHRLGYQAEDRAYYRDLMVRAPQMRFMNMEVLAHVLDFSEKQDVLAKYRQALQRGDDPPADEYMNARAEGARGDLDALVAGLVAIAESQRLKRSLEEGSEDKQLLTLRMTATVFRYFRLVLDTYKRNQDISR